jgi:hypothetical protein
MREHPASGTLCRMSYRVEWVAGPAFLWALLFLLLVPGLALIALVVVALAAIAALAAAIVGLPYLAVRSLRRHTWPMVKSMAHTVLANPTTARSSQ